MLQRDATDAVWLRLNNLFDELVEFAEYHDGPIWKEADEDTVDKLFFGAREESGEQIEYALEHLMRLFGFSEDEDWADDEDDDPDWDSPLKGHVRAVSKEVIESRSGRINLEKSNITEIDPERFYLATKTAYARYGQQCLPLMWGDTVETIVAWCDKNERYLKPFDGPEFVIVDSYDGEIKGIYEVLEEWECPSCGRKYLGQTVCTSDDCPSNNGGK